MEKQQERKFKTGEITVQRGTIICEISKEYATSKSANKILVTGLITLVYNKIKVKTF